MKIFCTFAVHLWTHTKIVSIELHPSAGVFFCLPFRKNLLPLQMVIQKIDTMTPVQNISNLPTLNERINCIFVTSLLLKKNNKHINY